MKGGLAVGAPEDIGVQSFVDDLAQHVARAEAGSLTNFGNHDGSLRSIARPSRLIYKSGACRLVVRLPLSRRARVQDLFLAAKDLSFAATANRSGVFSLRLACEPSLSNHLGDRRSVAASVRG
jgi:hypothetical protein